MSSVTDRGFFGFWFFLKNKGHCCAFMEEILVHIPLSFDGLINLEDAYCGKVSDSGLSAQAQYLTLQRGHIPGTHCLFPYPDLFALGMESTARLIQLWTCRQNVLLCYNWNSKIGGMGQERWRGGEFNFKRNRIYCGNVWRHSRSLTCCPSSWIVCILEPRGHLSWGTAVSLFSASWVFSFLPWP